MNGMKGSNLRCSQSGELGILVFLSKGERPAPRGKGFVTRVLVRLGKTDTFPAKAITRIS